MGFFFMILHSLMLVFALAIDTMVCSLSYGASKIKIPIKSMLLINIITTLLLGVGIGFGAIINQFIPATVAISISFVLLIGLGILKVFEGALKSLIKKFNGSYDFKFSMFDIGFVLQVFAEYELADSDESKTLCKKEAIPLALALGLDGFAVGLSIGFLDINFLLVLILSFVVGILCIAVGSFIGNLSARLIKFDFGIVSGLMLVILALYNLFS